MAEAVLNSSVAQEVSKEENQQRYPSCKSSKPSLMCSEEEQPILPQEGVQSQRWVSNLEVHVQFDPMEKPYICLECGKCFREVSHLFTHQQVHPEKHCKSLDCGKSFTQSTHLFRHRMTHTGERPYECSQCGKSFTQSSHLAKHQRTHV